MTMDSPITIIIIVSPNEVEKPVQGMGPIGSGLRIGGFPLCILIVMLSRPTELNTRDSRVSRSVDCVAAEPDITQALDPILWLLRRLRASPGR